MVPVDFIWGTFHSASSESPSPLDSLSIPSLSASWSSSQHIRPHSHPRDRVPQISKLSEVHAVPQSVGCYCISFSNGLLSVPCQALFWALGIHPKTETPPWKAGGLRNESSRCRTNRGAESWPWHFLTGALNRSPDVFVPQFPPVENGGRLVVSYSQNYSECR